MVKGFRIELDNTNQAMRVRFQDGEADSVSESPNGIARCGVQYQGRDTLILWVEMFDKNKTTLIADWVSMAIDQALGGGDDDYWAEGSEIVPVVRS